MPINCGDSRRLNPSACSIRKNENPPRKRIGMASIEPFMSDIPSGTSTIATAPIRMPPPKAITKCRNSFSSQSGRICSNLAITPPTGIQIPATLVRIIIVNISDISISIKDILL